MTTFEGRVYVWTWLVGADEPVVAGAVEERGGVFSFGYARSYLRRCDAVGLGPELPLVSGLQAPREGLVLAGCLRDGLPDAWGQRVLGPPTTWPSSREPEPV